MLERSHLWLLRLVLGLGVTSSTAVAQETVLSHYVLLAQRLQPDFTVDAERGKALFQRRFALNDPMPACTSCHGDDPRQTGRHAVTGKRIDPLAPVANPQRFQDLEHTEKWFRRNCRDVMGRECTAAEKADVIAYLRSLR